VQNSGDRRDRYQCDERVRARGERVDEERNAGEYEEDGGEKFSGTAQGQVTPVAPALRSGGEAVERIGEFD